MQTARASATDLGRPRITNGNVPAANSTHSRTSVRPSTGRSMKLHLLCCRHSDLQRGVRMGMRRTQLTAVHQPSGLLDGPVRITDVARAVNLSADRLGRLFARDMGLSFQAYVRWARLMRALEVPGSGHNLTDGPRCRVHRQLACQPSVSRDVRHGSEHSQTKREVGLSVTLV